ncbi:hypothetical protein GTX07_25750 [Streptomyces sp. SID5606]|nr:hypothetical protein [Streptomyces sp. SID5606]
MATARFATGAVFLADVDFFAGVAFLAVAFLAGAAVSFAGVFFTASFSAVTLSAGAAFFVAFADFLPPSGPCSPTAESRRTLTRAAP